MLSVKETMSLKVLNPLEKRNQIRASSFNDFRKEERYSNKIALWDKCKLKKVFSKSININKICFD